MTAPDDPHPTGFNEARADSPGRCGGDHVADNQQCDHASMRPGPIRPGDTEALNETADTATGFSEARADSPGRFA